MRFPDEKIQVKRLSRRGSPWDSPSKNYQNKIVSQKQMSKEKEQAVQKQKLIRVRSGFREQPKPNMGEQEGDQKIGHGLEQEGPHGRT
jgi:hypothetical protein